MTSAAAAAVVNRTSMLHFSCRHAYAATLLTWHDNRLPEYAPQVNRSRVRRTYVQGRPSAARLLHTHHWSGRFSFSSMVRNRHLEYRSCSSITSPSSPKTGHLFSVSTSL